MFGQTNLIYTEFVMIDNHNGASANIGSEGDKLSITIRDSKFYGETPARDCN